MYLYFGIRTINQTRQVEQLCSLQKKYENKNNYHNIQILITGTYLLLIIITVTVVYFEIYLYFEKLVWNSKRLISILMKKVVYLLSKLRSSSLHVTSVYGILMLFRTANKPYNNLCTWYTSVQNLVFNFFLVFLRDLLSFNRSRWVSTPMILGKPCTWQTFRNSKISISNPKLASIRRRTWYDKKINTLKQRLELGLK